MIASRTLAGRVLLPTRPVAAVSVVVGSIVIALAARVAVPLPYSPVPVTAQTFAVLLLGAALGSRLGAATLLAYIAEGLLGLPVFASGNSAWSPSAIPGLPYILGPTAGYLVGFVAASFVVGRLAERGWDRRVGTTLLAMALGDLAIYLFGLPWLARFVGASQVLALGLLPFLAGDAFKIVLAAVALPVAWRSLRP